jgi:hypothetical protein
MRGHRFVEKASQQETAVSRYADKRTTVHGLKTLYTTRDFIATSIDVQVTKSTVSRTSRFGHAFLK